MQIISYADIVLVGRTVGVLKEATTELNKAAKEMGTHNYYAKKVNTWKS
jgi:hypothetical protein